MTTNSKEKTPNSGRKLFFGLFIFPLLIAVGMAVLLCSVVLLTTEKDTPESLIMAIKTGSPGKRWQKAFELSNELNKKNKGLRDDALAGEIAHILQDPTHYDAKTRAYMAVALSHFNTPQAVDVLRKALKDDDAEVQIYTLWGLASLKAKTALSDCLIFLKSDNAELRKVAAYVLGVIGEKNTAEALMPLLLDPVADVRWNSALALARLGNDSGKDTLLQMVDRDALNLQKDMNEDAIESVMINAIKGLTLIAKPDSIKILQSLSKNDKSMKVRQMAIQSLDALNKGTAY